MFRSFVSACLLSFVGSALAIDITGRINWNDVCPDIAALGHAKAVLDDGYTHYGGITRDGHFTIPNVEPGTYLLSILAHDHAFDKLRIDVPAADGSESLPEVRPYIPGTVISNSAASLASVPLLAYPPTLAAKRRNDYFVERESFNLVGMFQNPMMMMMAAAGVLMLATPYLMKNMDPDSLKEFNERQAQVANIQSSLHSGDIRGGLSALMDVGGAGAKGPESAPANPGVKSRPGKGKRK
ncbi:hypothetical protein PUNSTDRAFT_129200 [Punctularia strigosozonata HHB-11173 SS5]|uniref:uncharacterized protein n=1 Tax=Punctularia strigosozonata (strain HHB-11173) TaxID=741275 RepID=UPI0004416DBA|nr:uncharacterized protein PUNSTDRAFT_129200 [Punctularia strigosozonata HHB-11173 SS5]EIN13522.1 hypothetical protein PUNSTDRAFT_129200 [Punctularia strigosozonata HHB-11173 SS5]